MAIVNHDLYGCVRSASRHGSESRTRWESSKQFRATHIRLMPPDISAAMFPQHFDGKRFYNPDAPQAFGLLHVVRWKLTSRPERSPEFVADVQPSKPQRRVEGDALRATLVNHSTVLLQHRGCNILTDPIWSNRASPVSWTGPHRRRAPGVSWDDLPPIDIVLISHNHYDHLDLPTLRRLAARKDSTFIVPARMGRLLRSNHLGPLHELDWGESARLGGLRIHGVPALHFSARWMFDRNRMLWCGYMIEWGNDFVYFAGDTAFGNHFARIREVFGPPRLALLPIGAYEPRWFMSRVHMAPGQAVNAHRILGARTSIAIHHGTFQLGDEGLDTPRDHLLACAAGEPVMVLRNGESAGIP
jgi:L-ascorbate metabolism protein UlaG (beta-lactamase superfamily)